LGRNGSLRFGAAGGLRKQERGGEERTENTALHGHLHKLQLCDLIIIFGTKLAGNGECCCERKRFRSRPRCQICVGFACVVVASIDAKRLADQSVEEATSMLSKTLFAATLSGALLMAQAVAAQSASGPATQPNPSARPQAPLPAGRSASIREAQGIGRPLLFWTLAGGAIIAGVILLAQDGDEATTTTAATTGTGN
jgi:hypothetical protein